MAEEPLRYKGREISLHKAYKNAEFGTRTVLTKSPWTFVALWLKRKKKSDALVYWEQAQEFYEASSDLSSRSSPLTLYYCYMNAAKALLSSQGVAFSPYHGVTNHRIRRPANKTLLSNEGVKIKQQGIVPSLSKYFAESESSDTHTLQELIFNLAFVHRTYCLTFRSQRENFLPLVDAKYVFDKKAKRAFCKAYLEKEQTPKNIKTLIPGSVEMHEDSKGKFVRSKKDIAWRSAGRMSVDERKALLRLHQELRSDFHYINGVEALWYLRLKGSKPKRVQRSSPTITLAVMHRLSEISRYRPIELRAHFSGSQNWLLNEFIEMSSVQFLDEIATEITGHKFLIPNVRPAR